MERSHCFILWLGNNPVVRSLIDQLIAQPDTEFLSEVLTEAYLSASSELTQDQVLCQKVLRRVASLPELKLHHEKGRTELLDRFPKDEVAAIANTVIGAGASENSFSFSRACFWLSDNPEMIEVEALRKRLISKQSMPLNQLSELVFLLAQSAPDKEFFGIIRESNLKASLELKAIRTPYFGTRNSNSFSCSLAEISFIGLSIHHSWGNLNASDVEAIIRIMMQMLVGSKFVNFVTLRALEKVLKKQIGQITTCWNTSKKQEFALLSREVAGNLKLGQLKRSDFAIDEAVDALNNWADLLEGVSPAEEKVTHKRRSKRKQPN
jgi:hypothetical protein